MDDVKRLQLRFRRATIEYVPAARVLGQLTEHELADRVFVEDHLKRVGLPEMASIVHAMAQPDYQKFVQEIEDTSEEEGFH